MSSRYAFTKSLKEVRFLFCQTSEQSAAVRYASFLPFSRTAGSNVMRAQVLTAIQILHYEGVPDNEEEQPPDPHPHPRGGRHHPQGLRAIRYEPDPSASNPSLRTPGWNLIGDRTSWLTITTMAEFGNEKNQSLEGLTDKQIEETVTGMVKNEA